jgi:predicted permease
VAVKRQDPYLDDSGRKVLVDFVSENYFPVLAAGPALRPEPMAVVSDRFWKRHFNSDPGVAGKIVRLNGQRFMVIAVAPRDFGGVTLPPPDIWVPLATYPQVMGDREILGAREGHWLAVAGRLKPGATLQHAQAEIAVLARNLEREHPETNKGFGVLVSPASWVNPRTRNNVVPIVALLMGSVGLVLLIACANVANLLLARALSRQKELGVRLSLGASRGRLIRQLLTESTLLSLAGGAVGLLATMWIPRILFAAATRPDLRSYDFDFDTPLSAAVLTYSLILSLVTGAIFGLAPALQFTRPDLSSALKDGGAFGTKLSRSRLRNTLMAGQVAFSLVLLIVSGLFARSVLRVNFIDPGFDSRGLLTLSFDPQSRNYSSAQTNEFYKKLLESAQLIRQVQSMSLVQSLPLGDGIRLDDFEIGGQQREVAFNIVSANYFRLLGVPALIGRSFEPTDKNGSPAVVMINESAARRFWPGQDPLGKRLRVRQSPADLQVIGVIRDFRDFHIASPPQPYVYIPVTQAGSFSGSDSTMQLLIRTNGDVRAIAPALRREAAALDRELHVTIQTIDQIVMLSMWPARVGAALSGAIGLLALALATVGIYGTIAHLVSQRRREIGIRIALGAQRVVVVGLVLRQALRLVGTGAAVGVAGALAVGRVLGEMLYGLSSFDALTFVLVPLFLVTVAMLATYIPALRAAKVDPMVALRYE